MARFRNPRYAPESLERRLSPSYLLSVPMPVAQVMQLEGEPIPTSPIPIDQVPPDPSDGPIEPTEPPIDPVVPA